MLAPNATEAMPENVLIARNLGEVQDLVRLADNAPDFVQKEKNRP